MNASDLNAVTSSTSTSPKNSRPLARVLTEVFAPWVIVLMLPLAVAWRATHAPIPTVLWGLLVALTSSIIPMGVIVWGARTKRWEGHHVRNREGRLIPFLTLIVSSLGGVAALIIASAPWPLIALDISMLVTLVVGGLITIFWKISMHTAVAGGTVIILAATYSPALWVTAVVVAAVGWSRVVLNDHTSAQVTAGAVIGAAVGGGLYAVLVTQT
ncbi:phosphatase PAP2 family protein [Actinopolyspora mortivallis]|uniref:phosphatase PAP2 family protein n=1 Tax=Actinopolyspora mortivallis TaxID=33906 RepID=UPI00039A6C65|nr:phosphatase PAP2 family protein [Actinopolyspora mortivallis]